MSDSTDSEAQGGAPPFEPKDDSPTQDLKARFRSRVTAEEQRIRTRGAWMIASGAITVLLALTVAVVWYQGFNRYMPTPFILPLYGIGFGLAMLGVREYLNRPTREIQEQGITRIEHVERQLNFLVKLLPDELQQRFYQGRAATYREVFGTARTGTNDGPARGTADVLKMQRRSDRSRN